MYSYTCRPSGALVILTVSQSLSSINMSPRWGLDVKLFGFSIGIALRWSEPPLGLW